MLKRISETANWWFVRPDSSAHLVKVIVGGLLWGWAAYELALGAGRWLQLVDASCWWLPFFPIVVPLLSLQAVPSVIMILLVPVILKGPDDVLTRYGTIAALSILAVALAAALPVVQHYVELFFLFWF